LALRASRAFRVSKALLALRAFRVFRVQLELLAQLQRLLLAAQPLASLALTQLLQTLGLAQRLYSNLQFLVVLLELLVPLALRVRLAQLALLALRVLLELLDLKVQRVTLATLGLRVQLVPLALRAHRVSRVRLG
jgi:hypothetical protein